MKIPDDGVKTWQQLSLLSGGPVEIILRIGLFPEADHCQFLLEARTAGQRELIAMRARPHVDWNLAAPELDDWLDETRAMFEHLGEPFPEQPLHG